MANKKGTQKTEITTKTLIIAVSIIAVIIVLLVAGYFLFFHENAAKTQQTVIFNNGIFTKKILPGNPTTEFMTLDNAQDYFLIAFSPTDSKLKTDNDVLTLEENIYLIATNNVFDIELTYNSKSCGLYLPIKTSNYNDFTEEERMELINKIKEEYYPELDCDLVNVFEKSIIEELNNETLMGNLEAQKNTTIYLKDKEESALKTVYFNAIDAGKAMLEEAKIKKQYSDVDLKVTMTANKTNINPFEDEFIITIVANKPLFKNDYILKARDMYNNKEYYLDTEPTSNQNAPFVAQIYWDGCINNKDYGLMYKNATFDLRLISPTTDRVFDIQLVTTNIGELYLPAYSYNELEKAIPPDKYSEIDVFNHESKKTPIIFNYFEANPGPSKSSNPNITVTFNKTYQLHSKSVFAYKLTPSETEVVKLLEKLPFLENIDNLFLREQGVFEKDFTETQKAALNSLVEKNIIYLWQPYIATITPNLTETANTELVTESKLNWNFFEKKELLIRTFLFSDKLSLQDAITVIKNSNSTEQKFEPIIKIANKIRIRQNKLNSLNMAYDLYESDYILALKNKKISCISGALLIAKTTDYLLREAGEKNYKISFVEVEGSGEYWEGAYKGAHIITKVTIDDVTKFFDATNSTNQDDFIIMYAGKKYKLQANDSQKTTYRISTEFSIEDTELFSKMQAKIVKGTELTTQEIMSIPIDFLPTALSIYNELQKNQVIFSILSKRNLTTTSQIKQIQNKYTALKINSSILNYYSNTNTEIPSEFATNQHNAFLDLYKQDANLYDNINLLRILSPNILAYNELLKNKNTYSDILWDRILTTFSIFPLDPEKMTKTQIEDAKKIIFLYPAYHESLYTISEPDAPEQKEITSYQLILMGFATLRYQYYYLTNNHTDYANSLDNFVIKVVSYINSKKSGFKQRFENPVVSSNDPLDKKGAQIYIYGQETTDFT